MKKLLSIMLLALVGMTAMAQKEIVWQNPSAFMGQSNADFKVTKVELKQTETVLHFRAKFRPHNWISFAKKSFLLTPDGKEYIVTSGAKTCDNEYDLELDSLFWMPDSGEADLALHFKPVPLDTKEFDFLEGYEDGAFQFWSICDEKTKKELEIPADWKNVKYANDETLPVARLSNGNATIKVKLLGYKPAMKLKLWVYGFTPLGTTDRFEKDYTFADDGTLTAEIPIHLARQVNLTINGLATCPVIIAPGQEISILVKVSNDQHPVIAFKGYMAKTNMDFRKVYESRLDQTDKEQEYEAANKCANLDDQLAFANNIFQQKVDGFKSSAYTTAAKDLLCMEAEYNHLGWLFNFANKFSNLQLNLGKEKINSNEKLDSVLTANRKRFVRPQSPNVYTFKYLNKPTAPCSQYFWEVSLSEYDSTAVKKAPLNHDLYLTYSSIRTGKGTDSTGKGIEKALNEINSEACKAIIREYQAKQKQIANQLSSQESVFYNKFNDVAPEQILQTILDKYKGKTVLIDIWATWCGPCRMGHQKLAPLKQELKDSNVKFVYITSPTSPLATWQEMIKDIDGEHYYLTKEQYNYVLNHFESDGIPTYAIYDPAGNQTFKNIGFPGVDKFKEEITKTLK